MNNKRRFISLFSAVLHIIVLLIVFLFFGNKIAVNKSEFNDKNEFYSKCLSNYIVYGLSDEQKIEYSFSFLEIQKEIANLIKALQIDMLYICIDELWLIDDKNNISFQPMFLDYLRQTFLDKEVLV